MMIIRSEEYDYIFYIGHFYFFNLGANYVPLKTAVTRMLSCAKTECDCVNRTETQPDLFYIKKRLKIIACCSACPRVVHSVKAPRPGCCALKRELLEECV